MPVQTTGFVPGGVVQNQQLANPFLGWHSFGHFIEEELKHMGIDAIDNQTEQRSGLGRYKANDILAKVIPQIGPGAALARLDPAAARSRIALDPAFVAKP